MNCLKETMESRLLEYRPIGGGLDYHHNSPLIGEIPPGGDYSQAVHRSIDQLRNTLNERVTLGPLSVFSNTADIRTSVLNYTNQPHQQHQQSQYQLQGTVSTTTGNVSGTENVQMQLTKGACMDGKLADSTTGAVVSSSQPTSGGRGRKSKIYTNPNQHIIVTSNSVDNGGTRAQNRQQQNETNNNGISSSTSSPHHHMQMQDIKDTKIFTSKADLQLHTQMHMRESKPYKCTQCSKAFANSSYLSQHTRIHLGIKPYRCEICQRKFTQLSHLQQHIRTHTGDKPYKCRHPGCQKAFSQLSNLQSHSRCHQTDKPFKCNSCYKCFSDEASLLDHIPKHKESKHLKTHICQYCGKSYTQETYLNKHMQKHSERTDKRPPIVATNAGSNSATGTGTGNSNNNAAVGSNTTTNNATATAGVGGGGSGGGGGHPGTGNQHNRNNISLPPVTIAPTDNSYWPKVSPDSAANMNDVMHQQQPQQQQQHSHQQHHQQQQQQAHNGQQPTQQQQQHHHPQQTNTQQQPPTQQQGQTHMDYTNHQASGANNPHNDLQNHHRMNDTGREDIVSTPSTVGPYDASSITKTTTNSAFTPINSMPPHLNTLSHHAMSQRPYLYDAISFQNKNVNQNNASNSFPNQLISLHQIRNYAHQPAGLTMAGEHLLGVSVGPGKDKG
ncbi:zinc finger protein rotund isoform X5 [Lucilia cuprina]|uniref:zinc finger protein rotund isoform X5 n=1 Tax=Lucilia cuprina TaxID=7375 RepID=UPI001F060387|nr:zinc finger protein rotund isoform X5 [Lucilia cuprina]